MQDTIKCPKCGEMVKISQAISDDIEAEMRKKFDKELAEQLRKVQDKARQEAEDTVRVEQSDLKAQLDEKDRQLRKSEEAELALRKKQRELEDKQKALELEVTRKVDAERRQIAEKAQAEAEEAHRLKDADKDRRLADLTRQIEDLKRKAEQGSQQAQGEVLELDLEDRLREEFQFDVIEPVEKGRKGGDVLQTVKTQSGRECGKILWETKRTKEWSNSWLQKVKNDQREAKVGIGVIVSEALPKGFHHFREVEGVWVTDIPSTMSLAIALRFVLIQETRAREAQTGKETKMETMYTYLTGVEFRNRVQAVVESFNSMRADLDAERRVMEKHWAKREKYIQRVIANISGMHGELEAIAGSLPAVKLLELPSDVPAIETETVEK